MLILAILLKSEDLKLNIFFVSPAFARASFGAFVAKKLKNNGFSLTEVLMAVGILSVGMMLIATMFPVGIYLTGLASERTMAAIVADEAFAKIRLYGIDSSSLLWNIQSCLSYENVPGRTIDPNEFSYPSVDPCVTNRQYYWSASCNKLSMGPAGMECLVTVFVARRTSPNLTYLNGKDDGKRPVAVSVEAVNVAGEPDKLEIPTWYKKYVNPPTTILDPLSGRLYRVIDRMDKPGTGAPTIVTLDRNWVGILLNDIRIIPPPDTGGKNADVEVFQRIIRF